MCEKSLINKRHQNYAINVVANVCIVDFEQVNIGWGNDFVLNINTLFILVVIIATFLEILTVVMSCMNGENLI